MPQNNRHLGNFVPIFEVSGVKSNRMFKFPSLFGRIPRHQKFNFEPRFYDAQKEQREARFTRIKYETDPESAQITADDVKTRLAGSFKSARKLAKNNEAGMSTTMMRLLINLLLVLLLIAWLQWGNVALYMLLLIVPVYAWFRFFKK